MFYLCACNWIYNMRMIIPFSHSLNFDVSSNLWVWYNCTRVYKSTSKGVRRLSSRFGKQRFGLAIQPHFILFVSDTSSFGLAMMGLAFLPSFFYKSTYNTEHICTPLPRCYVWNCMILLTCFELGLLENNISSLECPFLQVSKNDRKRGPMTYSGPTCRRSSTPFTESNFWMKCFSSY
jgi:hypothetical protein